VLPTSGQKLHKKKNNFDEGLLWYEL